MFLAHLHLRGRLCKKENNCGSLGTKPQKARHAYVKLMKGVAGLFPSGWKGEIFAWVSERSYRDSEKST